MKLQLKHLASYLPYKLKVLDIYEEVNVNIKDMVGLYSFEDIYTDDGEIDFKCVKPILRPLSDLTKEIEVNGEKFVPIYYFLEKEERLEGIILRVISGIIKIENLPYWIIKKLLEWHFDIYGLIEAKLAIDINTLDK